MTKLNREQRMKVMGIVELRDDEDALYEAVAELIEQRDSDGANNRERISAERTSTLDSSDSQPLASPGAQPPSDERFEELLAELIQHGCSCDAMNGYSCKIHQTINDLRTERASAVAPPCNCDCLPHLTFCNLYVTGGKYER